MRWCCLSLLVVLRLGHVAAEEGYCLATDNEPHLFFASKTAYEFVYNKKINHLPIPDCEATQIWMLSRHGTSYPSRQRIAALAHLSSLRDNIVDNHRNRKNGNLCHEDLDGLINWNWKVAEELGDTLAKQGKTDMEFLAKRLKTNFPSIFGAPYTPDRFTFKYNGEDVARASAQDFAEELLGHGSPVYLTEENTDTRLSMANCSTLKDPEVTSTLEFEIEKFRQSPLAAGLINSVSTRLGFLYNLTFEAVVDMYDACGYEKAWEYHKTSPWCAAFDKRDLRVLEYFEDLKEFYKNGYGNNFALKFGCPLVKDLIEKLTSAEKDNANVTSGKFYWGDEALLEAAMARLGMANDKKQLPASLRSLESYKKRQWRTAFISPFAGNVAAVLYKCSRGEANQVMFYINEHTVMYEGCNVGLCSWQYLKKRFTPVISDSCGYEFCQSLTDSSSRLATSVSFLGAALILVKLLG